ncbi:uncharacterized protein LOC34618463 [Cyclospora cayetanensis]|uniref:Uncharacterized protein LOC34618463 n=1 Tax=Cyclospora cayetanensis TaxID=88456 RepID=A0A6P5WCE9_9EIME|nr:uncharacterized protein LOC34618463 [Cyclospora cayetanensis]
MFQSAPVRPLALGFFVVVNALLTLLWWREVQVERHTLPDPCSFSRVLSLSLPRSDFDVEELAPNEQEGQENPSSGLSWGSCIVSRSILRQRWRWKQRSATSSATDTLFGACGAPSTPPEELLQWTVALRIVPLCIEAQSAARDVFRTLASMGDAEIPTANGPPAHCASMAVASVLAAAGVEVLPSGSGSSNALLNVYLNAGLEQTDACPPLSSASDLETAAAAYAVAVERVSAALPETKVEPPALQTLRLLVSSAEGLSEGLPILHIGSDSSLVLLVPRTGNSSVDAATQKTAAEAVIQALGRWILSPAAVSFPAVGSWRVRLWLLGDGVFTPTAPSASDNSRAAKGQRLLHPPPQAFAPVGAPTREAAGRLEWDVSRILRTSLRGFLEALSSLVDLSFASQVVPHSGLQELDWARLSQLLSGSSQEAGKKAGRAEEAVLEETQRRLLNIQEQWEADQTPSPSSKIVNLGMYKPSGQLLSLPPQEFTLAVPFWGFLTFGAPASQTGEFQKDGTSAAASPQPLDRHEAAALSAAWIAQLRSLLGLQPESFLTDRRLPGAAEAAASCAMRSEGQHAVCGKQCEDQRCQWRLQAVDASKAVFGPDQLAGSRTAGAVEESSLKLAKALLVHSGASSDRKAFVYLHPSPRGITDWELGGLAADMHFAMIKQAAENVRALYSITSLHTDMRIPEHVGRAIKHVLDQLECSVEALRLRQCAGLPAAALELLQRSNADTICTADSVFDGCTGASTGYQLDEATAYRQLALLLARSALRDSSELLTDGSLEPAPFFSLHFNLAIHMPLMLPFILPTVASIIRATKSIVKRRKIV